MEVKRGYKKTVVGVIPEDWGVCPLPEIVWFQEGPGLRKWQFRSGGLKIINVTNLQENGYLDLSKTERHISWEEFERTYKHFLIDDGDIVMASSGNSYCKTAVVRQRDQPLLMNTSVIRFKARDRVDRSFILIYLKSKYFKDQIDLMITGGAQPNFGPAHLIKVLIPLPPTKTEQAAIAEALSDADTLIESLEQLLTKKRQIKKGTMQELLTGKKRLPGFSGKWEVKRLGDESDLITKGTTPTSLGRNFIKQGINFVKVESLTEGGTFLPEMLAAVDEETHHLLKRSQLRKNDILFSIAGALGRTAIVNAALLPANTNQALAIIRLKPQSCLRYGFILKYLSGPQILAHITAINVQAAQANLSLEDIRSFEVSAPSAAEQTAIAAVLSDMDAEITALEARLSKAHQIKQGMMQELLTGRIRLV